MKISYYHIFSLIMLLQCIRGGPISESPSHRYPNLLDIQYVADNFEKEVRKLAKREALPQTNNFDSNIRRGRVRPLFILRTNNQRFARPFSNYANNVDHFPTIS